MFDSGHFLTVPQIIGAVRRKWFSAGLLVGLIVFGSAIALFLIRDKFESEGSLYLKAGRATLTVDPTATTGATSNLLDTRQAEIQSIKEMLGSRILIERTAEKVGLDRIMDQRSTLTRWLEQLGDLKTALLGKKSFESLTEEEIIALERLEGSVEYISKQMKVRASKDGNTVSVTCRAHTPFLAHDIVENLMKEFNDQYIQVHKNKGSLDFFIEELEKSQRILAEKEASLRDLKDELQMMSVEDKRSLIQQELSALQAEMISSQASLTSVVAEIEHLYSKMDEQPPFVDQETTDKPSYASELMRQNLYALEVTENELKAKYTDDHPQVVQVRDKLQKSRAIFDNLPNRSGESKKMANPIRQELEKNLITARGREESLIARIGGLKNDMEAAKGKMKDLNSAEIKLAESTRAVDKAREDHRTLAKKLEEARIQDELDQSVITDIRLYQPASLVLEKAFPQRGLMLAAVSLGALFVGLAFAVWRDQTDYRLGINNPHGIPIVLGARTIDADRRIGSESMSPMHTSVGPVMRNRSAQSRPRTRSDGVLNPQDTTT